MLSEIKVPTTVIPLHDEQSFAVRGITVKDLSILVSEGHRSDIDAAVAAFSEFAEAGEDQEQSLAKTAGQLLLTLPALAAKVIAVAADEPDQWSMVMKLPVPAQLEALLAIGSLTFSGEDSLKNFVGGLFRLMASVKQTMDSVTATASTGLKG